jgi:hypothetical protein
VLLTSIVSLDPIYIYFDMDEATYLENNRLYFEGKRPSSRRDLLLLLADAFSRAGVANPAAACGQASAGELEFHRARMGEIHRSLQPHLRPAVPWLWQRRRLRDPAWWISAI